MVHGNMSSQEKKLNWPETLTGIHFLRKTHCFQQTALSKKLTIPQVARNYLLT